VETVRRYTVHLQERRLNYRGNRLRRAIDPHPGHADWQLSIRGGSGPLHVKLVAPHAAACSSGGPVTASGKGMLDGPNTLEADFRIWCHSHSLMRASEYTFAYNPLADEMVDQTGLVWHRG
jgi:hypothetical protein